MKDLLYTVWISLACKPGSETFKKLLSRFKTPEEIYNADENDLKATIGSKSRDYLRLLDKELSKAEEILDFCISRKVGLLSYFDEKYPKALKGISNPPVLLYYRGVLPSFDDFFAVSVVGTRNISSYGRKNTFIISKDLAKAGVLIVSGMALGVDGVAHAAALSENMPTVAVLGSGIDICYPSCHLHLAREIVKCGCVMTEYAPGTKPERYNFPVRNRIISALSSATVVMEGDSRSGALHTARHASAQGRSVFAFPGNVGNPNSEASNLLIKNGASMITNAYDIISAFEKETLGKINHQKLLSDERVDINSVLSKYKVSCVARDDDVFKPSRKKCKSEEPQCVEEKLFESEARDTEDEVRKKFSSSVFMVYKNIPVEGDCPTDSLIGENITLRDVMSGLLKLQVAGYITMLPGDRVKRTVSKK